MEFTDQQKRVIDARGHNVLVSAAAGSGKTAVLVERIIRMISEGDHPLDIDRLLVVTFTRAAAAQMRERIGAAISKRLEERPGDRHLQRQEILLHRAQISTIDSFCTTLLRGNISETDLDPGFRQMDETEAKLLAGDTLKRYLEEQYARALENSDDSSVSLGENNDSPADTASADISGPFGGEGPSPRDFLACAEYFCPGGNDGALEKLIAQLSSAADSHPWPEAWLEERRADYDIRNARELQDCGWYRDLLRERLESLREAVNQYDVLLRMSAEPGGPFPWSSFLLAEQTELKEKMTSLLSADESSAGRLRRGLVLIAHTEFARIPTLKKKEKELVDPEQKDRVQKLRGKIKDRIRAAADGIEETPEVTAARMQQAAGPLNTLIDLTLGYRRMLHAAKMEKNAIDFSDLEHYALQILIDRAPDGTMTLRKTAAAYRACYDEVLIDEYQDSNEVQELLLSAVTGETEAGFVPRPENASDEDSTGLEKAVGDTGGSIDPEKAAGDIGDSSDPEKEDPATGESISDEPFSFTGGNGDTGEARREMPPASSRYARFMVGDVKQSIYRFRNARPEIFRKKFDTYAVRPACAAPSASGFSEEACPAPTSVDSLTKTCPVPSVPEFPEEVYPVPASADSSPEICPAPSSDRFAEDSCGGIAEYRMERIDLDRNFRSRMEVLDAANGVCEKIMRREIGGVEYDDVVSLKPGASYPPPVPDAEGTDPYQTELLIVDCAGETKETTGSAEEAGFEKNAGTGPDRAAGARTGKDRAEGARTGKAQKEAHGGKAQGEPMNGEAGDSDGEDEEDEIARLTNHRKEALAVAQKIRTLVGALPVTDPDTGRQRPARYGDIVILLRSVSGRQDAFREIFEKEGIPLYLDYKGGYFQAEEVRCVLQYLRTMDNPRQDIPMYGAMRGYFGGFTLDEIGQIRSQRRGEDDLLYDALLAAAGETPDVSGAEKTSGIPAAGEASELSGEEGISGTSEAGKAPDISAKAGEASASSEAEKMSDIPEDLREKCAAFLAGLRTWRLRSRTTPVHELIGDLVRGSGYGDYVRSLPAGARRAANLRSLLVKASAFEQTDYAGLSGFLRYIDQMEAGGVDFDEAGALDERADVVRLTTIHKSKGLEYPICFVCGLGSRHSYTQDLSGALLTDADLGLGIMYTDVQLHCSIPTLRRDAVSRKIERDAMGEELRVLYVAMTRAKEKLILTGTFPDAQKKLRSIRDEMSAVPLPARHLPCSMILSRDGFLPLIVKSLTALEAEHRTPVRVSTVPVTDLQLSGLEDQMTAGVLRQTLLDMETRAPAQLPDPALADRLERRFSCRYPHEGLTGLYTKTTVTELKRAAMMDDTREDGAGEPAGELYPDSSYEDFLSKYDSPGHEPASRETAAFCPSVVVLPTDPTERDSAHSQPFHTERSSTHSQPFHTERDGTHSQPFHTERDSAHSQPFHTERSSTHSQPFHTEQNGTLSQPSLTNLGSLHSSSSGPDSTLPVPRFALEHPEQEGARLTGAARGTAVHHLCERMDYREWPEPRKVTAAQFEDKVNRLLAAGEIPASYARIAKPGIFLPFLRSDIVQRMAQAEQRGTLRREQPFVMGVPAGRMRPSFPEEETILIQGIMDAFFAEGEGTERHLVLVDYKTDRVQTAQELADRYRVQMDYYAEALEKMLRLPVADRVLYSFALQEEIHLGPLPSIASRRT